MSPLLINAVGTVAALCSMTSFIPQVMRIWKEKDASAVSLRMYVVTVAGFALWTGYGVLLGSWPLVASNVISLLLSGAVLAMKLKFGNGGAQDAAGPGRGRPGPATSDA